MTQELTTTRDAGGAIKTTTPGAPSAGYGALFDALIRQKMAQQAYQRSPAPQTAQAAYREPEQPTYRPTMGTAQSAPKSAAPIQPVKRMRMLDSNQDMLEMRGSAGLPGLKRQRSQVEEYQLPDGSWSLDAVYGTLAGNEAAARQRMEYLQRSEGGGGGRGGGMEDVRRNTAIPWTSKNRNQDARGTGYGMDYGRPRD